MARLALLLALSDAETAELRALPADERYEYMQENFEEAFFGTPRCCELDKAWEGIQYCLGSGEWNETNEVPMNIIFGGEFLVDTDAEVITLKSQSDVAAIAAYLREHNLQEIIQANFWAINDEFRYKNADGLEHILGWSEGILAFYEEALRANHQVIFTVDL